MIDTLSRYLLALAVVLVPLAPMPIFAEDDDDDGGVNIVKPKLKKLGVMVFTSDTKSSFRLAGNEAGGDSFPDIVFGPGGSVEQVNEFSGSVTGKSKGIITHGYIRETFNRVERASGNDLYTIQAHVEIQWLSPEGYIYDMDVMGNILSDGEAVIPLLTSTFVLPNENFYCWFGGTLRTNDPDLARFNGRTVVWGVAEERILLPEGVFQSTAVLYGIESPEDVWDLNDAP